MKVRFIGCKIQDYSIQFLYIMSPENEDELCHILLTELLAYQFAWPVRWIETQDVLLKDFQTERLIEVGPQPILANMATKTIKENQVYEEATSIYTKREIYSTARDLDKIYYKYEPAEHEELSSQTTDATEKPALKEERSTPVTTTRTQTNRQAAQRNGFSRAPKLDSSIVVKGIIVGKLPAHRLETLPTTKTLKELCGGKSTLQNEIKGDLLKEIPSLADQSNIEDMPVESITDYCEDVSTLGPVTQDLVTKFIPRKFAGQLNSVSAVRQYLCAKWGVEDSNALLLFISLQSVTNRFHDQTETEAFIDMCCANFAKYRNIDCHLITDGSDMKVDGENEDGEEKKKVIDYETFNGFNDELLQMQKAQHQVLAKHLNVTDNLSKVQQLENELAKMKKKLEAIGEEFGNDLIDESLSQTFSPNKIRVYDSSWNWCRQSILKMLYTTLKYPHKFAELISQDEIHNLVNRADSDTIRIVQYVTERYSFEPQIKNFFNSIVQRCLKERANSPFYSNSGYCSYKPISEIQEQQETTEVTNNEKRTASLPEYVKEISQGSRKHEQDASVVSTKLNTDMSSYYKVEKELFEVYSKVIQYALATKNSPSNIRAQFETVYEQLLIFLRNSDQVASFFRGIINEALISLNKTALSVKDEENDVIVSDCEVSSSDEEDEIDRNIQYTPESVPIPKGIIPFLHLKRQSHVSDGWVYDKELTQMYLDNLMKMSEVGIRLGNKTAMVTAIDANDKLVLEVIRGLLQAGARVYVATQRFDHDTTRKFQECFKMHGATGSKLVVMPLNLASKLDIRNFVSYFYKNFEDIDFLLPFHVKAGQGSVLEFDSQAELDHRSTNVNLLRFLGAIVNAKKQLNIETRPTHVLLPLSPNHANINEGRSHFEDNFLSSIINKWCDEEWSTELSICGCVYGWTNDDSDTFIAEGLEKLGVRTFSCNEMAFNVIGLLSYHIIEKSQKIALIADLNGGLQNLPTVSSVVSRLNGEKHFKHELRVALKNESRFDSEILRKESIPEPIHIKPKGNINMEFPEFQPFSILKQKFNQPLLHELLDLSKVVVITGLAEVGPWGNARTRWEMESKGEFSIEGCLELAWIMGLITYDKSTNKKGWLDAKTGEVVDEYQIKDKYEKYILKHTGIRLVEPELFGGYDPHRKQILHEVIINHDLDPVEMSSELAQHYKLEHGEYIEIQPVDSTNNSQCMVRFLKGCTIFIPKALNFDRFVAGQIPAGWDPRRYGISEDVITQVDPITLFSLVTVAEAFISSGISDPYELYKYVHVSEVGNCYGSGVGGLKSHLAVQTERLKDETIRNDVLPETFINVSAAWINMLFLSSSGPIKTPVGACATAVESLDNALETILSGKAKVCIAGGCDDFSEETSTEFAKMGATSNTVEEINSGRSPQEMCRPATSTRNGFMESQGAGMQVLMSADLAIKMGVPIYGILGMACTASDKISKSLPAPGKGVLTCAKETHSTSKFTNLKLNVDYRRKQLNRRISEIEEWVKEELESGADPEFTEDLAKRQKTEARAHYGNNFWRNDSRISPIKGCLATFGLTIDDLNVASFHGTSTKANEKNESSILNAMMNHLGRTEGNPLFTVCQKYLTGHPKGAAGAWMFNGVLQILRSGLIPGNRNADNIDEKFSEFNHLVYPSENIEMECVKAACITSFGFGQKGAMAIAINPNYVFAALSESEYEEYGKKLSMRQKKSQKTFVDGLINNSVFVAKDEPPYSKEQEEEVYLDSLIRANEKLEISIDATSLY